MAPIVVLCSGDGGGIQGSELEHHTPRESLQMSLRHSGLPGVTSVPSTGAAAFPLDKEPGVRKMSSKEARALETDKTHYEFDSCVW